jgi:hypothetical protein
MVKVTRDSLMGEYAQLHPQYGFERHKGYGTAGHIDALGRLRPVAAPSLFIRARMDSERGANGSLSFGVNSKKAREGWGRLRSNRLSETGVTAEEYRR